MMNRLFAVLTALTAVWVSASSPAADTNAPTTTAIPAAEARNHIGEQLVVTGKVVEVNVAEKLVRLNLDQAFPKTPFTAVIFAPNTNRFGDLKRFENATVAVEGKVTEYRGRPQIVLTSTNQVKLLSK